MSKIKRNVLGLMLATVVSFGFWACSQDEGMEASQTTENVETNSIKSTSNNKPVIKDEGDRIFSEYVSSIEFVTYYNAIEKFNNNLNNGKTINDFESDEEMFSWIENNIPATRFIEIGDATRDWSDIINVSGQLETKFPKVTDFYRTNTKLVIGEKVDKWFSWGIGLDFTTTLGSCADDLRGCRQSASNAYAERAHEILEEVSDGTRHSTYAFSEKTKAMTAYSNAVKACINEYHNCNGTNN